MQFEPLPNTTFARPATCSTEKRISASFSSSVMVAGSPVVPKMTSTSVPFSIWKSIIFPNAAKLTPPSLPNGVIIAVAVPLKKFSMMFPSFFVYFYAAQPR